MSIDTIIAELAAQLRSLAPEERQMHIDRLVCKADPESAKKIRIKDRRTSRTLIDNIDVEMLERFVERQG